MRIVLFLHLIGSIGMGFYILFPFLLQRLGALAPTGQAGYAGILRQANRFGQFLLILMFLTGGYLIGKGEYSTAWMIVVVVVFVLIGATTGMMGGPLKRLQQQLSEGRSGGADAGKARLFAALTTILFLVIIVLMKFPDML